MTRFIVINENTLACTIEGSLMVQVLAGSVIRGGSNPLNGPIFISPSDKWRDVTFEDFDHYGLYLPEKMKVEIVIGRSQTVPTTDDIPPSVVPLTKEDFFCICKTDPGFPCPHCDF